MPKIVQSKSTVLAVVTDVLDYIRAREQADALAREHGLVVADMPLLVQAMDRHAEVRKVVRPSFINTVTSEYHGLRDGKRSYEVWHSVGSLATADGLGRLVARIGKYGFMPIANSKWDAVGKGMYHGQSVARVHLDDVRKGSVPAPGTPYTIFARLDSDTVVINNAGQLSYNNFIRDDRVLMVTGSPDGRERLAKLLFGSKAGGGEWWGSVGSYHRVHEAPFDVDAKGRPLHLYYGDDGLDGYDCANNVGRFVGVGAGGASQPTLEERTG